MSKWLAAPVLFILFTLMGCSSNGMEGDQPPKSMIQIGKQTYEMKLGSYCWNANGQGTCVDTLGPVEQLKGKKPIEVRPGEVLTFVMNYHPKPNEFHLTQMNNNHEIDFNVEKNRFTAPVEKGIYYYSYGVWWMDEKDEHLSNGSASYAFALEVK
ncbi:hypothetical protein [Neobacillus sp. PS2-9]|uniref:hypothetical protein n=1 Tax=Neobacillus sp. PS2-9 TaxID=3070676 RepID=UPI0027E20EA6|nr:hypothetical protein [Neobacillus sp. PS2-9]WML58775.1 hypothetical protein RCG25_02980 [Neobacillus sp. PS2-9]